MRKKHIPLVCASSFFAIALCSIPAHALNNIVVNGDFSTGDLTGWTSTFTPNGTSNPAASVTSFDVTGLGSSEAATLNVGLISFPGQPAGAGIAQALTGGPGDYAFSVDFATFAPRSSNSNAGTFTLLFNGIEVNSFNTGPIERSATIRGTLSGALSGVTTSNNTLELRVTRPFITSENTPFQYFDNVVVDFTPVPGPLPLLGAAAAFGWSRKLRHRIQSSKP